MAKLIDNDGNKIDDDGGYKDDNDEDGDEVALIIILIRIARIMIVITVV